MKIEKNTTVKLETTLKSKGTVRIRTEQDGTVSIEGYLYRTDGKPYGNQMKFMDEFVAEITKMVAQLHNGIPAEVEDRKWFEFWKIK